ncbi:MULTISPECIES: DNA repair protein RecO [unclassified Beijerinckia]|uniref:DNA repair protein RecO n=1 Tax=unclassified Beijerinckia TaxID=2638183 RepID=UPI00089C8A0D|nr:MULTISPECIES: DNA repair protein RecO [unclassified Beijerinckia]MDH7794633.1 DNA repair protein RecO (recombination protein O) [Beijerinckia sp. GAS462]SEB69283.1 DNA replication and repair protein RecO [Beijerinckia sp. 28-YEA-48]
MEWRDEGIIIGLRKHGETSLIVELMTRAHGRHMGIVKGGRSRRMQPTLQQGNSVEVTWRARLEEHLGLFTLEVGKARAAEIMATPLALAGINLIGELLRLLPERDPHETLYEMASAMADRLGDQQFGPALMVRFELEVLSELGFRLDLSQCAATGTNDALIYVSPKTGRAVSASAGEPYKDRLLPLPAFLHSMSWQYAPSKAEIADGFRLTGYFLDRDVLQPRGGSDKLVRRSYLAAAGLTSGDLSGTGH